MADCTYGPDDLVGRWKSLLGDLMAATVALQDALGTRDLNEITRALDLRQAVLDRLLPLHDEVVDTPGSARILEEARDMLHRIQEVERKCWETGKAFQNEIETHLGRVRVVKEIRRHYSPSQPASGPTPRLFKKKV